MNTEIYIKAAELIHSGEEFSCNAIWKIQDSSPSEEENLYYELFVTDRADRFKNFTFYCLYEKIYEIAPTDEEMKEIRVLALLFAAEYFNDENNN